MAVEKKPLLTVLVRVLLLWTDTMTKASLIKTTFNWGWLTGSGHYHQGGSMAVSRQAWRRQSWEIYVFIQRLLVEDWLPGNWGESLKPIPTVTHLFQQGHTSKWCHSLAQEYTNHHICYETNTRLLGPWVEGYGLKGHVCVQSWQEVKLWCLKSLPDTIQNLWGWKSQWRIV